MPADYWIVFAVASALGGSGGALITWVVTREARRRERAEELAQQLAAEVKQLRQELTNLGRVAHNKLYRESFEDVAFAATQAALRLAMAEEELRIARQCLELGARK